MTQTDLLADMLAIAETHARKVLVGTDEQLTPLFDLRDAEGHGYLVAAPFAGDSPEEVDARKDAVAEIVSDLIRKHQIVRYVFLSEAWMVIRKNYMPELGPRPSEADDRIEVVIAVASDGADYQTRRWRIKRDGARCVDLVREGLDERSSLRGRFDNLLPRRTIQ